MGTKLQCSPFWGARIGFGKFLKIKPQSKSKGWGAESTRQGAYRLELDLGSNSHRFRLLTFTVKTPFYDWPPGKCGGLGCTVLPLAVIMNTLYALCNGQVHQRPLDMSQSYIGSRPFEISVPNAIFPVTEASFYAKQNCTKLWTAQLFA